MKRRVYPGMFSLTETDLDDLYPQVERMLTTRAGEIIQLEPWVAVLRHIAQKNRAWRQQDHGCADCGQTGYDHTNHLPCHCDYGRQAITKQQQRDAEQTERLRDIVSTPGWQQGGMA
jgi:hypothetical protein